MDIDILYKIYSYFFEKQLDINAYNIQETVTTSEPLYPPRVPNYEF